MRSHVSSKGGDQRMDIDFHYYATYVAARFAGYTAREAMLVASSAQMIDENGRHVLTAGTGRDAGGVVGLPDDFEIRAAPTGDALHTFRVLMTFQGIADIGTSKDDTLSSIWPVFHFLPGNFMPTRGVAPGGAQHHDTPTQARRQGPAAIHSARWSDRPFSGRANVPTFCSVSEVEQKFRWICRPHSPMATALVNHCADMVRGGSEVVSAFGLEPYLVGVTMHVFADTWAHQDFIGKASQTINRRLGDAKVGYVAATHRNTLPAFEGTRVPTLDSMGIATADIDKPWRDAAPYVAGGEERNVYVGHGQVGHWPDHSSLVWEYTPGWSASAVVRNNPAEYFDAFLHVTWAMYCIRNQLQYTPFDVNERSIGVWCTTLGVTRAQLTTVYALLCQKRDPFGVGSDPDVPGAITDKWDRSIFAYGREWQAAITGSLELGSEHVPSDWLPGRSTWVMQALEAYEGNQVLVKRGEARAGRWYGAAQFMALDFFRFNVAAKLHYRTVKQQLLAFNETLLGHWPDGSAYADDLERVRIATGTGDIAAVVSEVSDLQRTEKVRETSEGMSVLIAELAGCADLAAVRAVIAGAVASIANADAWTYGVRDEQGKLLSGTAKKRLEALHDKLNRVEVAPLQPVRLGRAPANDQRLPSTEDWMTRSSVVFARRKGDGRLVVIDDALNVLQKYRSGPFKLLAEGGRAVSGEAEAAATAVYRACEDWLEAHRRGEGEAGRRGAVAWLRDTVDAWAGGGLKEQRAS
jgi:hypothetical protein